MAARTELLGQERGTKVALGQRRAVVRVKPLEVDLEVEPGESLMEAAQRLGYYWPTRCRGRALCTACLVEIESGAENFPVIGENEGDALGLDLERLGSERPRLRLACQARPVGDGVVIKDGVGPADEVVPSTPIFRTMV